jgi:hypothetical protein
MAHRDHRRDVEPSLPRPFEPDPGHRRRLRFLDDDYRSGRQSAEIVPNLGDPGAVLINVEHACVVWFQCHVVAGAAMVVQDRLVEMNDCARLKKAARVL